MSGARYCSIIGDFNEWSPTENSARDGHFGHDDFGYWTIVLEDKLKEGQEADEYFFQEYNYVDDYDKGDNLVSVEELLQRVSDEYWEPGEDHYKKTRFEVPFKLYEQLFGPNGPQTEEELGEVPDAETRHRMWMESNGGNPPNDHSRFDVMDTGKEYDIFSIIEDPLSREKFRQRKPPIAYWIEMRKGRKEWSKKYLPAIPHGSKYRLFLNTPDGCLERIPAWATYVFPGIIVYHRYYSITRLHVPFHINICSLLYDWHKECIFSLIF